MYPSPQVDFGYDISNYEDVDPQYGTLADMQRLIHAAKRHHIRIILDMVLNHTSDKHPWFLEAASSRTSPRHNWYIWTDGIPAETPGVTIYQKRYEHEGRVPPNNWVSLFGGSAWEWCPETHQFYYHRFYKQQPDLNWRNPEVEEAMFGTMRFWLDRGVAGFRLDAIPSLFEDAQLRNSRELGGTNAQGDPNLDYSLVDNLPEIHDVLRRMRQMVAAYPGDRVLIGETYLANTVALDAWYGGSAKDELQLPMDTLLGIHDARETPDANSFRKHIEEAETLLHGSQPLFVFDNHDNVRAIDRYGDGMHDAAINKALATILLTTRDAALLYYGQELGMTTSTPTRKEDVKDPIGVTGWPREKGRDGERTPMQWSSLPQAGFSSNPNTWLPVAANYKLINVAAESTDPDSQLNWFRKLIALRRSSQAISIGDLTILDTHNDSVLTYLRSYHGTVNLVAINLSSLQQSLTLNLSVAGVSSTTVHTLATDAAPLESVSSIKNITLPPYASWIASVE
jgi:alpha-glucosidase